ncbi:MAG TPA: hypothetical protein VLF14_13040 [Candidatus Binatia bacterium]|nr:hypothetical protein [Candidatus Binatia bacterium]
MRAAAASVIAAMLFVRLSAHADSSGAVLWRDNDDLPIAEPAEDNDGDYIWWDGVHNMTLYPLGKVLDLGHFLRTLGEWAHAVGPAEAANVNALDEAPDSTWYTNRHARRRLSSEAFARGPIAGLPPADDGPLTVLSGKSLGMTPGFVMRDAKGDRYVVKFDPPALPEVSTGAELVCSKIVWALGWNVPEYHLFRFHPERLVIGPGATSKDEYGRTIPLTSELLSRLLTRAYRLPDGRLRAVASRFVPGTPKGSPAMVGTRADDPNDTVPHEDRRELRGLRVVAAFLNFTDARRGNFLDSFVPDSEEPGSGGHLVHYVLDFSSALGSGNTEWKDPKLGNEYLFDPPKVAWRALTLGLTEPAWAKLPLTHPALGYFDSTIFDPERWKTSYLNPLFDHATRRDEFWGAKVVTSLTDGDLRIAAHAGQWSDPRAETLLVEILAERRRRIARAYFDWRHIDPVDQFVVEGSTLRFDDLAVVGGVVDASVARYRHRAPNGEWIVGAEPRASLDDQPSGSAVELETSHDGGIRWSPPTEVEVAPRDGSLQVVRVERVTR